MPRSTASPIDDLTYDVLTVLQNKAKALEAYDKYIRDAEDDEELTELFVEMRRQDEEHVQVLKEALARRLDEELGYETEDDDEDEDEGDDDLDDDDGVYDEEDAEEIEEPTARGEDGPHIVGARGEDGPRGGAPRRGESTHRARRI